MAGSRKGLENILLEETLRILGLFHDPFMGGNFYSVSLSLPCIEHKKLKGIQDTFCITARWNTETEDLLSLRNRVSWEFEFFEGDILTSDKDDESIWKYEQRGPFKNKRYRKPDGTMGTKRTPYLYLGSKAKNAETTMMVDENVNTKAKIAKVYNRLQRQFRAKRN